MGLFYCEDECTITKPSEPPITEPPVEPEPEPTILPRPEPPVLPPLPLPEPKLVPLKDVTINAVLEGPLATIDFVMTYINPGENPIEATYEFPLDEETILSSLTV